MAADLSGSMHAEARRAVLRETSVQLVEKLLGPGDHFVIIGFTGKASLKGRYLVSKDKSEPLLGVARLEPTTDGWTNIEAAKATGMQQLLHLRSSGTGAERKQFLLLLTDGEATHFLKPGHALYSLWEREKSNLHKLVSFGKSGVTLALFSYGAVTDSATAAAVAAIAQDGDVARWMERLKEHLIEPGSIGPDARRHAEDGLTISLETPVLRDGKFVFEPDEEGIAQRLVLRSNFEVAYAKGELKAGLIELDSQALGRLTSTEASVELTAEASTHSEFELSPRPRDVTPTQDAAAQSQSEEVFTLRIHMPKKRFPLSSVDQVAGVVAFAAEGELLDIIGGDDQAGGVPLPEGLPKPSQLAFVAERPQDVGNTLALAAVLTGLLLGAGLLFYIFGRPVTVRVSRTGGAMEQLYRLGPGQRIVVGGTGSPMAYEITEPYRCFIKRTIAGKLFAVPEEGQLYAGGQPSDGFLIMHEVTIGIGPKDSETPEVELLVSITSPGRRAPAGTEDGFTWPT